MDRSNEFFQIILLIQFENIMNFIIIFMKI